MKGKKENLPRLELEEDELRDAVRRRLRALSMRRSESQLTLFDSDGKKSKLITTNIKSPDTNAKEFNGLFALIGAISIIGLLSRSHDRDKPVRPPFNAEYLLYLLLRKEERDIVIGDLLEGHSQILHRFNKRRADIWFYKQVAGSLFPLLRRALIRIGALVWLGRVLQRFIS